MSNFIQAENILSEKLKSCCNSKGQEAFPLKSASVLNELGLLYKQKSPDKISLIQSSVLLNGAIVRQPTNKKFQDDLHLLCNHVLQCSQARKQKSNLVELSECVKSKIRKMRQETDFALRNIKRIPDNVTSMEELIRETIKINQIKELQNQIAQQYIDIMAYISKCCIEIMGTPPCKYALVGMGSLARKEITPYSDFEHILVLEELKRQSKERFQDILEYFRWYSTIFHIIVINLQETIIPSVCIYGLNNFSAPNGNWFFDKITTRGISFDGMMPHACKFPLGRTQPTAKKAFSVELIKPVSEMLRYLDAEENLKNGYKLADILTKTCYVSGDKELYKVFQKQVFKIQVAPKQAVNLQDQILSQLVEDLNNFNLHNLLNVFEISKTINIKRVVYRSITLFISSLGRINSSRKNSNFAIVDEFHHQGKINKNVAHKLSLTIAIACHFRLHQYMSKKSQDDQMVQVTDQVSGNEKVQELLKTVGKRELVNFFCTVDCLQMFIGGKSRTLKMNDMFKDNPILTRLYILHLLSLNNEIIGVGETYLQGREIETEHDAFVALYIGIAWKHKKKFKKSLEMLNRALQSFMVKNLDGCKTWLLHYHVLYSKLCLKSFTTVINETDVISKSTKFDKYTFNFLMLNGVAKACLGHYHQALSSFRDLKRQDNENTLVYERKLLRYAKMLQQVSLCLLKTGHPQRALGWIFEAVEIFDQNFSSSAYQQHCYKLLVIIYFSLGYAAKANHYSCLQFEKLSGQLKQVVVDPEPLLFSNKI